MEEWKALLTSGLNLFNLLILSYFFLGNGVYTFLMVLSLGWVWLHNRRLAYQVPDELRDSLEMLPVTLILPAWNEQDTILESVRSALQTDYPNLEVIVVDDGSTDDTLTRLTTSFHLVPMDLIYRPRLSTGPVRGFYLNPEIPNLLVVSKMRGGKADALNTGINLCRTPYFSSLDADCILERDALLRLMRPHVPFGRRYGGQRGHYSYYQRLHRPEGPSRQDRPAPIHAGAFPGGGVLAHFPLWAYGLGPVGRNLDYLRGLRGLRTGDRHRSRRLSERYGHGRPGTHCASAPVGRPPRAPHQTSFTVDPVCWTECPATRKMLARQRRRWQLGLCQTLWKHREMLFNRKYGVAGILSFPFHLFVEGLGTAVEFTGYLLIPLAIALKLVPLHLCALFIVLGLAYGGFLSVGAVLLEELTYRRYPRTRDLLTLLVFAVFENMGYRQLVLFYRLQGLLRFFTGFQHWEKVVHVGARA